MKVKIKKLDPKAVIPSYSRPGDAGMDLCATSKNLDNVNYLEYGTSLSVEIPPGHVGLLFPRSSISNYTLMLKNSIGVIDENFRGEIKVRFEPIRTAGMKWYEIGDRIAQLIIIPYPQVEFEEVAELSDTVRGEGGFGSSGT